jgi:hypothetical protein
MISFCTLARDTPHLEKLIDMFKKNCPGEHEICIGDNSTKPEFIKQYKELADVYVRIEDKELFRMGIPWGHNRVTAMANSNKIFYLDSDEYPVWINPHIEGMFDINYVIGTVRFDFVEMDEILKIDKTIDNNSETFPQLDLKEPLSENPHHQDRIYNSRYVQFNGVCHATFHVPEGIGMRQNAPSVIILHNRTVRDAKDLDRMRDIIREQYSRMLVNPLLSSSPVVFGWAKEWKKSMPTKLHKFETFEEFKEAYD